MATLLAKYEDGEVASMRASDWLSGRGYGVIRNNVVLVPPAFMRLVVAESKQGNVREVQRLSHSLQLVSLDDDEDE